MKGPNKTGILFGAPDRGGAIHHTKWKMRGQAMPAAFYVGADPVHYLVAPSRYGEDELAVAGGIRGAPVEMVKCETVDLEVPASAEFVVEGEVSMEQTEPEGRSASSPATWRAVAPGRCSTSSASPTARPDRDGRGQPVPAEQNPR